MMTRSQTALEPAHAEAWPLRKTIGDTIAKAEPATRPDVTAMQPAPAWPRTINPEAGIA